MTERNRSERSLNRRGLFAAGGVVVGATALGAQVAGAHGSGSGSDMLYIPVKLVEALRSDAAVVELLESGERILVQTRAGASITDDGATADRGFHDYEADELLLVAALSPPAAIDATQAAALDPILDPVAALQRHVQAQYMTTITLGGAIDVAHGLDEVDGLLDRAASVAER